MANKIIQNFLVPDIDIPDTLLSDCTVGTFSGPCSVLSQLKHNGSEINWTSRKTIDRIFIKSFYRRCNFGQV